MSMPPEDIEYHANNLLGEIIENCRADMPDKRELHKCISDKISELKSVRPKSSKSQTRRIIMAIEKNFKKIKRSI